ncbi:unnamed protein product [Agarophyton chilense]
MEGASSLFVLMGAGILLLRPRDVPIMARVLGRTVGVTVRSLRVMKEHAEEVISENMRQAKDSNSEMQIVGRGLRDSLSKFDSVSATLRKDMADVPFSPRMWIQKGMRSLDSAAQTEHQEKLEKGVSEKKQKHNINQLRGDIAPRAQATVSRKSINVDPRTQSSSGVDFIARAIEEAALAQQQKRVFARPLERTKHDMLGQSKPDEK